MEAQLRLYKQELERVAEMLRVGKTEDKDAEHLQNLKRKLERIVELLESKVPKKRPKLANLSIKEGDRLTVSVDSKWQEAIVVEAKLPEYILASCAVSGQTIRIEDPKLIKLPSASSTAIPPTPSSNPRLTESKQKVKTINRVENPSVGTKATSGTKTNVTKKSDSNEFEERQQNWKSFNERNKKQRR